MPRTPLVIAHRGASGYRPEHTTAAYSLAFALGADAVEPDIVATRDGVLVLRHENEISGTTDVASRPEFADRRTTKRVDGVALTGWFTEDFTWEELRTLRSFERIPGVRAANTVFNGWYGILRLKDLMRMIDDASDRARRQIAMVAEIKHADYFSSIGIPLDELLADEISGWATGENLIVEAFEQTVLERIRARGVPGRYVFLLEESGSPADLVSRDGAGARTFADHLTDGGLARLATEVHGISVNKRLLLDIERGRLVGATDLAHRAHEAGLSIYCWTLRPENRFLPRSLRTGSRAGGYGDWPTEFRTLIDSGVDGVFADHPDLVRELLTTA
ncbi:glycerophosphodiester phosphodiesterase family protein [Lysobacter korlensis]|uniref:glycerophosphodiester phosphodiesterase n=1 Tax=Lysobacter korlensis TaxID=553636 RepID=A0ABV6RUY6_9GAMM